MTEQILSRNEEIQQIHKDYTTFYQLGGGLFLVLIGVLIGALIFSNDSGYGTNIYTEILSVGLTILVLNGLQERRDNRNRIKDLQEQLVREAGSSVNATARTAIDTMRKRGWLGRKNRRFAPDDTSSLLENANLSHADLHDVSLEYANLTGTNLARANLTSAKLLWADLTNANLSRADLTSADLPGVKLTSAELLCANLSSANLSEANLASANLFEANLSSADLWQVNLVSAILYLANLSTAHLDGANLANANLLYANLSNAHMHGVNLTSVNLGGANLTSADLWHANLASADLRDANLIGADLRRTNLTQAFIHQSTQFDESTILPDGSYWSEVRNLAEFGAETREIVKEETKYASNDIRIYTYFFTDGTVRRYQYLKGWLDDRDGNPITED